MTRDEILDQFVSDCHPVPSARKVQEWQARHPRFAKAFAEYARLMVRYPMDGTDDHEDAPENDRDEEGVGESADELGI